jgi:hypothetical protein
MLLLLFSLFGYSESSESRTPDDRTLSTFFMAGPCEGPSAEEFSDDKHIESAKEPFSWTFDDFS